MVSLKGLFLLWSVSIFCVSIFVCKNHLEQFNMFNRKLTLHKLKEISFLLLVLFRFWGYNKCKKNSHCLFDCLFLLNFDISTSAVPSNSSFSGCHFGGDDGDHSGAGIISVAVQHPRGDPSRLELTLIMNRFMIFLFCPFPFSSLPLSLGSQKMRRA